MEIFKCTYEQHENEAIIGFCLNSNCKNASQYCYKCLMKIHSDHYDNCIRFTEIYDLINQYLKFQGNIKQQLNDIYHQTIKQIECRIKKMDENIQVLKDLSELLKNQEYLKFKSSINILKSYNSLEQQKTEKIDINQLNEIKESLKQMEIENYKQQEFDKSFEQAMQLTNEGKHQDALKLYNKSLSLLKINDEIFRWKEQKKQLYIVIWLYIQILRTIMPITTKDWHQTIQINIKKLLSIMTKPFGLNPQNDNAYNNKGLALRNLCQYQNAIECYDKAIQLNPKKEITYNNKGDVLHNLYKYNEAIEYFEKAIELNPKNANAYHNKAFALHQIDQFQKAIEFYDQALSLHQNAIYFKNKGSDTQSYFILAETLLTLGKKQEAKTCYQNALNFGSADEDYIKKQLLKL